MTLFTHTRWSQCMIDWLLITSCWCVLAFYWACSYVIIGHLKDFSLLAALIAVKVAPWICNKMSLILCVWVIIFVLHVYNAILLAILFLALYACVLVLVCICVFIHAYLWLFVCPWCLADLPACCVCVCVHVCLLPGELGFLCSVISAELAEAGRKLHSSPPARKDLLQSSVPLAKWN